MRQGSGRHWEVRFQPGFAADWKAYPKPFPDARSALDEAAALSPLVHCARVCEVVTTWHVPEVLRERLDREQATRDHAAPDVP